MSEIEKKQSDGLHIDKKTIISITAILLAVYIFAGVLTQIMPRGEYNTFIDESTGKRLFSCEVCSSAGKQHLSSHPSSMQ